MSASWGPSLTGKFATRARNISLAWLWARLHVRANSRAALAGEWLASLGRMFPQFEPGMISERHLFRFGDAQHVVDRGYEAKIPAHETPYQGVFLSNFSQVYPEDRGTNLAVREGNHSAGVVASQLGCQNGGPGS